MNKKILTVCAAAAAMCTTASAGGYLTNTNQSISFLRQPAQNAVVSVNGAYFNPAGVGFLDEGWHLSFGVQNIHQTRQIESTYAPFALGVDNGGQTTKKFKGTTVVPVLPTFDLAYVHDEHWFGSFHFGVMGGGGKADFKHGLGSFESQIAIVPAVLNNLVPALLPSGTPFTPFQYGVDINILGEQYYFGGQLNIGYRVNDHLSFSAGLRGNYITCHYDAAIKNIRLVPDLMALLSVTPYASLGAGLGSMFADRELDCTQKAFAVTPILGVHYRTGDFDFAARYEFNTSIRLKNSTAAGKDAGLAQYADGKKGMANDMGALLSLGAGYTAFDRLHLDLGFNYYFDKQSKVYNPATDRNDKTDQIDSNPFEVIFGAEYDLTDKWAVSAGAQVTTFFWGDDKAFLSDMAFNPNSVSAGLGCRYKYNDRLSFDLAVFNTFYAHTTKSYADYNGNGASLMAKMAPLASSITDPAIQAALTSLNPAIPGADKLWRTSFVVGLGVNYSF